MNLPHDVQFLEEVPLLIYRPHGCLDERTVNKILKVIGHLEARRKEPFNRFWDTLAADEVELNFRYVIHVSLYRRMTYADRPPIKSAILATDSAMIHYGRLHALLTQGSPINVRVFRDRAEAAEWLEVPVERLVAES
jgi:hypothetical protein